MEADQAEEGAWETESSGNGIKTLKDKSLRLLFVGLLEE